VIIGEIFGPDLLIVIGLLVLLFGGSQIPKLAKSLGQAKKEFEKGVSDGASTTTASKDVDESAQPKP